MKCEQCGKAMKTGRENYLYRESGLPNVTLLDVEVSRCTACGEHEVAIPRILELHGALAAAIARKVPKLTPAEVRFLRTYLGWSGGDFAAHMGVTAETVSRWENGQASMGASAERLLRLAALTREPTAEYSLDLLREVARKKPVSQRLQARVRAGAWEARAA